MECKFCFAEMDEDAKICPACGKSQEEENEQVTAEEATEETTPETEEVEESEETEEVEDDEDYEDDEDDEADEPAKKKKFGAWKVVLAVLGVLVTALILTGAILFGLGVLDETVDQIKATAQSLNPWRENDIYYKKSYTAEEKEVEKKKDIVVATMGEYSLTNAELQIYYHMCVDQYGYYLYQMGFDYNTPYDEQIYDKKTGKTCQQVLLETALEEWYKYTSLLEMAKRANFQLDEEQQGYLDSLKEKLKASAEEAGYTDLDLFFKEQLFPGSSMAAYDSYNYTGYVGTMYYNSLYDTMYPTEAEVDAYFTANETALKNSGITKDAGNYYNVRHILICPTGGTKNEDGQTVYTEDAWETCRASAQKVLDEYLAGEKTDGAFAQLAVKYSEDPGSAEEGGLYAQLTKDTNFVEEFKAWYMDESRKPGDTGLVKSVHGYHIMYFCESFPIWKYEVEGLILTEKTEKMLKDAQAERPMTVNYKKIVLSDMAK